MSTRPPHEMSPRPRDPAEHELRVQLEGAWEVLEQARDSQTALLERLDSRRWLRQLHQGPEPLRLVREQEDALSKALERAERRCRQESWPEQHPLRLLTTQLRAQRVRVETLARNRLAQLGGDEDAAFGEVLERLGAKLHELPPLPPSDDELVLLTSGLAGWIPPRWLPVTAVVFTGLYLLAGRYLMKPDVLLLLIGLGAALVALGRRPRYWLTPRRLVWRPLLGPLEQIPLDSLRPDERTPAALPWTSSPPTLSVEGKLSTTLRDLGKLDFLHALLELHRRPPLLGRLSGMPTYPLALFPGTRQLRNPHVEHPAEPGMLMMRSGYVAFLSQQGLDSTLEAVFGSWPTVRPERLTLSLLLKQLRLLPEADFDRCVEQAVRASGGELWPTASVTHGPVASGGYQFISERDAVLTGFPDASLRDAIDRVLHHWPEPWLRLTSGPGKAPARRSR